MIKVTLEFKGVDEAIVALGKLVGAPVATAASSPVGAEKPAAPTARKPRADAGKKRGSYKNVEAPAGGTSQPGTESASESSPAASTPETTAPLLSGKVVQNIIDGTAAVDPPLLAETAAPPVNADSDAQASTPTLVGAAAPSEAEAQAALEAVFTGKGLPAAQTLLAKFEVTRLRDLPAEKRAAFIEAAKEVK